MAKKSQLTPAQKNKVQKIRETMPTIENPQKWFTAVKASGLTGAQTVQAARKTVRGITNANAAAAAAESMASSFSDEDLVGSENQVDEFGGDSYSGGGNEYSGGGAGGGSGSSLFGRESVSGAGDLQGQSIDEVVYGVKKRGRKVTRPRGE